MNYTQRILFGCCAIFLISSSQLSAQDRILVWAEEFSGPNIDFTRWEFETGPTNDNIHYYTGRSENMQIIDSVLHIIAREESYMGYNYTSALLKSRVHWQYGRIEARIKLPATNGFVPAFWMLPADNRYGWWPNSGEIDIMEHPTNEVTTIYGTVHSEAYNLFGGSGPPQGGNIDIADAETAFHVYAVEWTAGRIDFYVDDQMYYSFSNDAGGSSTWPFDQPFYIILNLAVGGGWVGNPDENTLFPAIMEVDYVRVYQELNDIIINGTDYVPFQSSEIAYSAPEIDGATYLWDVPGDAGITSGQNTNQVLIDWGYFGGNLTAQVNASQGSVFLNYSVKVSSNLLKNSGFEKGVKHWNSRVGYPAAADMSLTAGNVQEGAYALCIDVQAITANPWDIQISQKGLELNSGEGYRLSFWARTDNGPDEINVAIINSTEFTVYYIETFELSSDWTRYEINYTAVTSAPVAINIDLGAQTGVVYIDNFHFTTPDLTALNQIENADFFEGDRSWNLNTLSSAQASGSVINGEYVLSITDGGSEAWDVHLGQSGISIENGKEYEVTFDAYAAAPRTISSLIGQNSAPWTVYSDNQPFSLTAEKQTYTYSFIMSEPADGDARFGFDIGASTIDVYFDNIRVSSGSTPVNILTEASDLPKSFELQQNFPNPFNPTTVIGYVLPEPGFIRLAIFDVRGKKVREFSRQQSAGTHKVTWDGKNEWNQAVSSGIYYYQLVTKQHRKTKKMLLLK